jgi:hypothetical protein
MLDNSMMDWRSKGLCLYTKSNYELSSILIGLEYQASTDNTLSINAFILLVTILGKRFFGISN